MDLEAAFLEVLVHAPPVAWGDAEDLDAARGAAGDDRAAPVEKLDPGSVVPPDADVPAEPADPVDPVDPAVPLDGPRAVPVPGVPPVPGAGGCVPSTAPPPRPVR